MDFLNWYDWIQPANPLSTMFFGVVFTIIIAIVVWFETKEAKSTKTVFLAGLGVTIIGVFILNLIGYYS